MEIVVRIIKVSALAAALFIAVVMPAYTSAKGAIGEQSAEAVDGFLSDSSLDALFFVDTRSRTRSTGKPGGIDGERWSRLNYSSYNAILDFTSGYYDGWLGVDVNAFYAGDFYNRSQKNSNGDYLCNEIIICRNSDWRADDNDQFKIYRAALKFKAGEKLDGRVGLIQPNGNGAIGDVWAVVPGTYRGVELNAYFDKLKVTYFFADKHTAPWILSEDDYAPALWSDTTWGYVHSLGLQFNATEKLFLQFGIGQATDVVYPDNIDWVNGVVSSYTQATDTLGYKFYAHYKIDDTMSLTYDFYGVNDKEQYNGLGYTIGLSLNASFGRISWLSSLQFTSSENDRDVLPRMIYTYGMPNGNYVLLTWDALSDWNKSGQTSWYNRISYAQGNGWDYYLGFAYGSGSKSVAEGARGEWDYSSEYTVNATISYTLQSGLLKGSKVRIHGAILERDEDIGSRSADETDIRLQFIIPYSF